MSYPSDVTDAEWEEIKDFFTPDRPGRRPKHDRRAVYNAVRYVQRTGCQWRLLPTDFPPWRAVDPDQRPPPPPGPGEGRQGGGAGRGDPRQPDGQDRQRGFDGGKRTRGRKRRIAVDTLGLLLTVVVHSAGISDSRGARCVLLRLFRHWPGLAKLFVDGGYKTGLVDWAKLMLGYVVEVVQRLPGAGFQVLPKRWIVERSFGWLVFQRRFAKDYEHNPRTSEAMLYAAFSPLMLRRLHPL